MVNTGAMGLVPDLSNAYQSRSMSLFWGSFRIWKSLICRDKVGKYASQDKGEDTARGEEGV